MKTIRSLLILIARLCLAAIFIFAGSGKFIFFNETAEYMASKGLTGIPFFLIGAALLELVGGLSLIFGYKIRFGAAILLLFLIPTTFIFHDFWNLEGIEQHLQQMMFLKNLAIFGGLLYVICDGPGGFACDACCKSKQPEHAKEPERKV